MADPDAAREGGGHREASAGRVRDPQNYAAPLLEQYGKLVTPERTGKPGRPRKPQKQWPDGSVYATVNKDYRRGKVATVHRTLVHGTQEDLTAALKASSVSTKINTSFIERQNGTDRCHNSRKVRKTLEFSKDLVLHIALTWVVFFGYNFLRPIPKKLISTSPRQNYWMTFIKTLTKINTVIER